MLRVVALPGALLAISDPILLSHLERRIAPNLLAVKGVSDEREALCLFELELPPLVLTDSLELIRTLRARQGEHVALVVYVSELDGAAERERGLAAGADECVSHRTPDRELHARINFARRIIELEAALRTSVSENRRLSTTDDLTRAASQRFFRKYFPREVHRATRDATALSLILCDIDHFKKINDVLGHPAGDEVLRQFSARLQSGLQRGVEWVARIGGEEFAIVLPQTGYERALSVARQLRRGIADPSFIVYGRKVRVTASFGLCALDRIPADRPKIAKHAVRIADAALYRSKNAGRNRTTATRWPTPAKG
jgi:two-component system, cell cycle response regulator